MGFVRAISKGPSLFRYPSLSQSSLVIVGSNSDLACGFIVDSTWNQTDKRPFRKWYEKKGTSKMKKCNEVCDKQVQQ